DRSDPAHVVDGELRLARLGEPGAAAGRAHEHRHPGGEGDRHRPRRPGAQSGARCGTPGGPGGRARDRLRERAARRVEARSARGGPARGGRALLPAAVAVEAADSRGARIAVARKRLDVLLVERGLAQSRAQAQALVLAGLVPGYDKPGQQVEDETELTVERP